ncbi:MAG: hypothetical protein R3B09_01670 [Nannocystaceae bacterium]
MSSFYLMRERSRDSRAYYWFLGLLGAATAGYAGYVAYRRYGAGPRLPPGVVSLVAPVIHPGVAEEVLEKIEPMGQDEVTVLLHTFGGCVSSCVQIADALRKFRRSTAIVPYMAASGGTLIALNATKLEMGRNASLTAVDPIIRGRRGKNLPDTEKWASSKADAKDYENAIRTYLRQTLAARLPGASDEKIVAAMDVFMGKNAPHEWPIRPAEVEALGIKVASADVAWAGIVDQLREAQQQDALY